MTRSTFTSELLAALDAQDRGFLIAQMLHHMTTGVGGVHEGRRLREDGGYASPMGLYIDALSVYAAVTATFIKTPADNSCLLQLLALREHINVGTLSVLCWCDTRDMIADGLTKGAVDRTALDSVLNGVVEVSKPMKVFSVKFGR